MAMAQPWPAHQHLRGRARTSLKKTSANSRVPEAVVMARHSTPRVSRGTSNIDSPGGRAIGFGAAQEQHQWDHMASLVQIFCR